MDLRAPVVVLTGAGVSTASGIPDFRSPGGVWERFDPMEFTIGRFHEDPERFWRRRVRLIAAMDYLDAEPNAGHLALADAVRGGRVHTLVTQNVDGLHLKAGTPADRLIEVHGNGSRVVCVACGTKQPVRDVLPQLDAGVAPRCPACSRVLKPDVVLFGEPVPEVVRAAEAVAGARTLLVAGSSLQVYPAAGLVDTALASGCDVVICNREATPYDDLATALHRGELEEVLVRLLS